MTGRKFSARTLDPGALKSFAHPLRLRMYEELERSGPSTATQLAARLGENTGATSYHLRELARHGMIEQAEGLGRGKERYWRIVPGGFSYGSAGAGDDEETKGALQALVDDLLRQRAEELARWTREHDPGSAWTAAGGLGRRALRLTPEETAEMRDAVLGILQTYRTMSDEREMGRPAPGTARVIVHFDVLPQEP
ncbi:ArsR/SmtB family transcription factor [Nonomuraea longicatena]|uniref:Helix-turn-helix domain-containing protein n=1 Tax=Nonomuraea longicatena TaxID=83682 RepID=A0ABP3ZSE7_9ACTN